MNKILLGILVTGIFSACSNSELKTTVFSQKQEYKLLKTETGELKMEIEELNREIQKLVDLVNES